MKKWMKMTATMMAAAMALTACGGNDAADDSADAGETYTVGIIQQLEHPALDQATKGFEDKLTELLVAEGALHAVRLKQVSKTSRAIAYLLNCENEKLFKEIMVAFE